MTRSLRPVPDAAALLVAGGSSRRGRTLLVADLHLGLGGTTSSPHGPPGATAPDLAGELLRLAGANQADRLLIAGDVKHPIVGVPPALRRVIFQFFGELLRAGLSVDVVPGNHDAGLVPYLPREVVVHPATGVLLDGVGVFHGHRWPEDPVRRARRLVVGHLHPGVRFAPTADQPTGKRRCWVRVEWPMRDRGSKTSAPTTGVGPRELIVLPAFNPLSGTEALNRERPSRGRSFLFRRFLTGGTARAYLLDGTDVGRIPTPPADRPSGPGRGRSAP